MKIIDAIIFCSVGAVIFSCSTREEPKTDLEDYIELACDTIPNAVGGMDIHCYFDGILQKEETWKNEKISFRKELVEDSVHKIRRWWEEGTLMGESFEDFENRPIRTISIYFPTGELNMTGQYWQPQRLEKVELKSAFLDLGYREGKWVYYDQSGKTYKIEEYDHGNLIMTTDLD